MKKRLKHGGDWAGFADEFGYEPLDFSMNVNPAGTPPEVVSAIANSACEAWKYPDPLCRELVEAIADYENCNKEYVLCGCGAADIIYRAVLAQNPGKALVTAPTFGEYEDALSLIGCEVVRYGLDEKNCFRIGDDILNSIDESVDIMFICEPNNPTGVTTDKGLLHRIIDKCKACGTRLIIDECFNDFLVNGKDHSVKNMLEGSKNLVVLKAFTKNFSMAGVRLGYCLCSDVKFIEKMRSSGQPWSVSVIAQKAGVAALKCSDRVKRLGEEIAIERNYLINAMADLGIETVKSEANYILFRAESDIEDFLRTNGIIIRNCSNYYGLGEGWFRIAVKTRKDNERLIENIGNWKKTRK